MLEIRPGDIATPTDLGSRTLTQTIKKTNQAFCENIESPIVLKMKTITTVLLCMGSLSLITAAPVARENSQSYEYDYENAPQQAQQAEDPQQSASHYDAYIQDVKSAASGDGKKGFSRGSGLRTIAVGSANQAKTALGNQAAAAYQAAYVAKNTLAQSAAQASATAQAALAGKQVILSGLEQQVRDAKVALQGEEMQLQQAKRAAQAAAQAAQQAMHQVNVIQAALNAAQATSENANEAASQAAGELGAQTAMVGAARQRLHTLQEQLHGVRIDFEATQAAARKAQAAAQQAQANAAEAAAKAAAAGLAANKHDVSHEEPPQPARPHPKVLNAKLTLNSQQDAGKPIDKQPEEPPRTLEFDLSPHSRQNYFAPENSAKIQSKPESINSDYIHTSSHPKESENILEINEEVSSIPATPDSNTKHPSDNSKEEIELETSDDVHLKPDTSIESTSQTDPSRQKESQSEQEHLEKTEFILNDHNSERQPSQNQLESERSSENQHNSRELENEYEPDNSGENEKDTRQSSQNKSNSENSDEIETVSEQNPKSPTHENFIKPEDADFLDELSPENYVDLKSYFNGDKKTDKNKEFYETW
ncbi:hypothetical protein K1T71_012378 [Dendrolimus kikuchii]|uniref:Uncharacterized protein n=1 Tax=Dendrolimus kikuchii TaxID=765133 RepID=A0ACC1CLM4_9NEOP|nr:hypothetical protein K1T71_012378 [Dendrolimus kikuchii]